MPNHLINENSPYLLQHADNPVDWYPWSLSALEKARAEDKPIFLSIGYAACHWCHVMAHESFEEIDTAAIMNKHFVNIKVDREERPDLDSIYMQAVVALTGQGGWPTSVFLTPEGVPFLGGTYFPPVQRYNLPGFKELLSAVANAWENNRQQLLDNGKQILEHIQSQESRAQSVVPTIDTINEAISTLAQSYDWQHGGWGRAPKFPQPMSIEFLWHKATRGDGYARDIAIHALESMAKGGMYDLIGGGFARYSTDDNWLVPHFEKMLYDNAQLALAYLHGWKITRKPEFKQICEETLDFVLHELTHPDGGFFSSLDADSEDGEGYHAEGAFYIWSLDEIRSLLHRDDQVLFFQAYDVTERGNFEGKNVLRRKLNNNQLAEAFDTTIEDVHARLRRIHNQLLDARANRPRPATDDKIITSWNALMLRAFAEAGRYLHRIDYTQTAVRNANFLLQNLYRDERLLRSWRDGNAQHKAYLEDYAALAIGLFSLYQSDPNPQWYHSAQKLVDRMLDLFADPAGGFFDTGRDAETLITRPKDLQDNATPCGNSLAVTALLQLAVFTGDGNNHDLAIMGIGQIIEAAEKYPTAFSNWLCAADLALGPIQEVVLVGNIESPVGKALQDTLWDKYNPRLLAALINGETCKDDPPLAQNRPIINDQPTAYVCYNFICQKPVQRVTELSRTLEAQSANKPQG